MIRFACSVSERDPVVVIRRTPSMISRRAPVGDSFWTRSFSNSRIRVGLRGVTRRLSTIVARSVRQLSGSNERGRAILSNRPTPAAFSQFVSIQGWPFAAFTDSSHLGVSDLREVFIFKQPVIKRAISPPRLSLLSTKAKVMAIIALMQHRNFWE